MTHATQCLMDALTSIRMNAGLSSKELAVIDDSLSTAREHIANVSVGKVFRHAMNSAGVRLHGVQWLHDDIDLPDGSMLYTSPENPQLNPVTGDVLPAMGSRVFIRHGRDDDAHPCTVTGYFAWVDLDGNDRLHRVFVRLVYEGTDREQARMVRDCYKTAEAALSANQADANTSARARFPSALSTPPQDGAQYWTLCPTAPDGVCAAVWGNTPVDQRLLSKGIVFTHRQDAVNCHDSIFGGL